MADALEEVDKEEVRLIALALLVLGGSKPEYEEQCSVLFDRLLKVIEHDGILREHCTRLVHSR